MKSKTSLKIVPSTPPTSPLEELRRRWAFHNRCRVLISPWILGRDAVETIFGKAVIPFGELLWRFGVASAFGLVLGLDREFRGISAGVRTHMLVALSSAMTMLIALEMFEELSARGRADPDPTRAIQGLAQAIGFLCAGVIFVARGSVYGLTTAASLWMTSSIGMAAGAGMYQVAFAGLIFAVLIVTVMWLITRHFPSREAGAHKDDA